MRLKERWKRLAVDWMSKVLAPGRAGDEGVTASEEGDEELFDDFVLALDDLCEFAFDTDFCFGDAADGGFF